MNLGRLVKGQRQLNRRPLHKATAEAIKMPSIKSQLNCQRSLVSELTASEYTADKTLTLRD